MSRPANVPGLERPYLKKAVPNDPWGRPMRTGCRGIKHEFEMCPTVATARAAVATTPTSGCSTDKYVFFRVARQRQEHSQEGRFFMRSRRPLIRCRDRALCSSRRWARRRARDHRSREHDALVIYGRRRPIKLSSSSATGTATKSFSGAPGHLQNAGARAPENDGRSTLEVHRAARAATPTPILWAPTDTTSA